MNLGIGLSLTSFQRVPTVPLEDLDAAIAALFGSGEVGAWYDPSDLTTLYQDSKGLTPVTGTGQPVGLMLDKSKGLTRGSELMTNGTFDSNGTGWTVAYGTFDFSGGTADGSGAVYQNTSSVIQGKTYEIKLDITRYTSGSVAVFFNSNASGGTTGALTATGSYTIKLQCLAPTSTIYVQIGGLSPDAAVDNVSIKELPGNHATQTTSAARPVLQQSGGLYYLDFDGVDDYISTTFASAQAQPNTVSFGYKFDTITGGSIILVDSPTSDRHVFYRQFDNQLVYFSLLPKTLQNATLNNEVATLHFNSPSSEARINGASISSGDNTGSLSWGGVRLGASSTATVPANGRIYSFVGVNRTLTAGEITDLETYLAAKSGVTL